MCSCVVTIENSLQKSKGYVWLKEAPASIRFAGVNRGLAEATVFAQSSTASSRWRGGARGPVAAKPPEPSELARRGTKFHVRRGGCRKAPVEEVHLSIEVVSDRTAVKSSRVSLRGGLGAVRVCGPMRSDSQAGASLAARQARHRFDRWRTQGKKTPRRSSEKQTPKHRSSGATTASWKRWVLDRSSDGEATPFRAGGAGGNRKSP